ncbi:MAG: hypothetical protein HYZ45_08225, partial [Burkholderiales bacterium]|nr:hypothetical protein [Burkholderiales bacterium]
MKPGIVIAVAAAVILGAGAYAIYGVDDKPQTALDTRLENNVNGLFGKITAQSTGSASSPQKNGGITGRMQSFEGNPNLFEFYTRNK